VQCFSELVAASDALVRQTRDTYLAKHPRASEDISVLTKECVEFGVPEKRLRSIDARHPPYPALHRHKHRFE
jgi:hypothetical protein